MSAKLPRYALPWYERNFLGLKTDIKKPQIAADVRLDTQAIKPDCHY
ncbi:hypothetical protein [Candidatus Regiella insecticola]|nr:hypothetical protein [Candidatus Regiella insecticola]